MRQRDGDGGHFVRERALEQAAGTRQLREGRLQRRTRGRDGPFLWHERGGEAAAAPCLDCSHHRTVAWREEEKRHVAAAAVTAAVTATAAVTVAVAAAAAAAAAATVADDAAAVTAALAAATWLQMRNDGRRTEALRVANVEEEARRANLIQLVIHGRSLEPGNPE
eukprot:4213653-Pleurochrysis_carterae.AAC.1